MKRWIKEFNQEVCTEVDDFQTFSFSDALEDAIANFQLKVESFGPLVIHTRINSIFYGELIPITFAFCEVSTLFFGKLQANRLILPLSKELPQIQCFFALEKFCYNHFIMTITSEAQNFEIIDTGLRKLAKFIRYFANRGVGNVASEHLFRDYRDALNDQLAGLQKLQKINAQNTKFASDLKDIRNILQDFERIGRFEKVKAIEDKKEVAKIMDNFREKNQEEELLRENPQDKVYIDFLDAHGDTFHSSIKSFKSSAGHFLDTLKGDIEAVRMKSEVFTGENNKNQHGPMPSRKKPKEEPQLELENHSKMLGSILRNPYEMKLPQEGKELFGSFFKDQLGTFLKSHSKFEHSDVSDEILNWLIQQSNTTLSLGLNESLMDQVINLEQNKQVARKQELDKRRDIVLKDPLNSAIAEMEIWEDDYPDVKKTITDRKEEVEIKNFFKNKDNMETLRFKYPLQYKFNPKMLYFERNHHEDYDNNEKIPGWIRIGFLDVRFKQSHSIANTVLLPSDMVGHEKESLARNKVKKPFSNWNEYNIVTQVIPFWRIEKDDVLSKIFDEFVDKRELTFANRIVKASKSYAEHQEFWKRRILFENTGNRNESLEIFMPKKLIYNGHYGAEAISRRIRIREIIYSSRRMFHALSFMKMLKIDVDHFLTEYEQSEIGKKVFIQLRDHAKIQDHEHKNELDENIWSKVIPRHEDKTKKRYNKISSCFIGRGHSFNYEPLYMIN